MKGGAAIRNMDANTATSRVAPVRVVKGCVNENEVFRVLTLTLKSLKCKPKEKRNQVLKKLSTGVRRGPGGLRAGLSVVNGVIRE